MSGYSCRSGVICHSSELHQPRQGEERQYILICGSGKLRPAYQLSYSSSYARTLLTLLRHPPLTLGHCLAGWFSDGLAEMRPVFFLRQTPAVCLYVCLLLPFAAVSLIAVRASHWACPLSSHTLIGPSLEASGESPSSPRSAAANHSGLSEAWLSALSISSHLLAILPCPPSPPSSPPSRSLHHPPQVLGPISAAFVSS
ncbi:unnamed protein product [Pleuronectes platessa]|uniref:Uncharacterized protein n=1 Tax=Pleuronectes platessa TaxID=8262 RepID=A0A9N7VFV2_PLEPL|nr:unnamed protein product [Pleuronectes platessa]